MTIQLTTKKKKIITNYQNETLCKTFFSCNIYYVLFKQCCYCFVRCTVYHLSVCKKVNRQYKHHLSCTMHYHRRPYRRTHVRRYFTKSWKIFTGNATITDDFADGLPSVGISQRVEKILLEMPQSPTMLRTDSSLSVCFQWVKITDKITDERTNSKGRGIKCISDRVSLPTELPTDCEKYGG